MPRTQVFSFDIGDQIKVIEINRPGVVTGMLVDDAGPQYRVAFWNDSARRTEWVYDHEISLRKAPDA